MLFQYGNLCTVGSYYGKIIASRNETYSCKEHWLWSHYEIDWLILEQQYVYIDICIPICKYYLCFFSWWQLWRTLHKMSLKSSILRPNGLAEETETQVGLLTFVGPTYIRFRTSDGITISSDFLSYGWCILYYIERVECRYNAVRYNI